MSSSIRGLTDSFVRFCVASSHRAIDNGAGCLECQFTSTQASSFAANDASSGRTPAWARSRRIISGTTFRTRWVRRVGSRLAGTSTVTRLLNLAGAWFGEDDDATEANDENPLGFWERRDVRAVCDALLRGAGAGYGLHGVLHSVRYCGAQAFQARKVTTLQSGVDDIANVLAVLFSGLLAQNNILSPALWQANSILYYTTCRRPTQL